MKNSLLFFIKTAIIISFISCSPRIQILSEANQKIYPSYDIVIIVDESESALGKAMEIFFRNGLTIIRVQHNYLSSERQDLRICIKTADSRVLNEVESQLREILIVEQIQVVRL